MLPESPWSRGGAEPSRHRPALLSEIKTAIRSEPLGERYAVIPGRELGRGKFAVVRKYTEKCSGRVYAAKFVRKRRKGQDCRLEIIHEIAVLELASACPWVIDLHEVYETASEMVLVLEYAAGGEIFNQCVAERDEAFSEEDVRRLMRQILEGVAFLHSNDVVHLDLKPQNILLTSMSPLGNIKIVDFGLSRVVSSAQELREIMGTPEYVAPEILNFEPISTATDMWSVGVLAYVMLTGTSPFLGNDKQETFLNISQINVSYAEEELAGVQQSAISFMKTLLVKEPNDRASAQQCLQHQWLLQHLVQVRTEEDGQVQVMEEPRAVAEEQEQSDDGQGQATEEQEQREEGQGQATEEPLAVAAYGLGQCRQSEKKNLTPNQKATSKRFRFEEPFGTLQEIIY